ncbi:MAG: AmmeMemoRadiSam system protein A [Prolixibacteraceae bacterium]
MTAFQLNTEDKLTLLEISRNTLNILFGLETEIQLNERTLSTNLQSPCGAFVSIYCHSKLRGCIGQFNSQHALYLLVADLTRSAALNDHRFDPITIDELPNTSIELSILTPMEQFYSLDELELGKHGIYIKKGMNSGTYLPQVYEKTNWTKEEFLGHCSKNKAGIGWNGWKNAELYRYEAILINDTTL